MICSNIFKHNNNPPRVSDARNEGHDAPKQRGPAPAADNTIPRLTIASITADCGTVLFYIDPLVWELYDIHEETEEEMVEWEMQDMSSSEWV